METVDFTMTRGDTLAYNLKLEGLNQQPLTAAYFSVKTDKNSPDYVFQRTLGNGITLAADDLLIVRARPEDTAELEPNTYYYDLQITIGNDIYTIQEGKLIINKGVTEE